MASPVETEGSFLTQAQADHINERHVFRTEDVKTSNFWLQFNLVDMLKNLSELTWEQDNEDVVLLEQGWKESHGHFYLYVFKVEEQIGFDPEDFPANHSCHILLRKSARGKMENNNRLPVYLGIL